MNQSHPVARKSLWQDLKRETQLFYFYRRYQKAFEGQIPFEEKIALLLTKITTSLAVSWRRVVKRALDVVASFIGLVLVSPVMAVVAIAVKLESKGPAIFKQTRVGLKGKVFNMMKFRTMHQDAEAKTGPVWAQKGDPRVTRFGRFLRETHLDELPQLINVLKGEMSLVGPRPERPYFVNEFRKLIPHYDRRLCVKPGITGLAQLKRHYDETIADVKKKLKYDVLYAQKICPYLDAKLLAMTVGSVILRTGR